MKKETWIFIIVLFMCIGSVAGIYCYNKLNKNSYCLNLSAAEGVSNIILEQNENGVVISNMEEIKDIIDVLNGVKRVTKEESIQDSPINVNEKIKIDFKLKDNRISTIWVYEKDNKYYIEQAYNGIYRISSDEYNSIEKYIRVSNQDSNSTEPYIPEGMNTSNQNNIETPSEERKYNRSPENVTIKVNNNTITTESVEITISDNNEDHYGWGVEFRVQQKVNGEWKELKYISDNLSWISIAYELGEDNEMTQKLDIEEYYGKLEKGTYRIIKPVYDNGYIDIYSNEFEIK